MSDVAILTEHARKIVALKLWYVRWLIVNEGMAFDDAVRNRVGLFRMTTLAGSPARGLMEDPEGWTELLAQLGEIYRRHASDADSRAVEAEGLALLWPHAEPVVAWEAQSFEQFLANATGCFQYEFTKYYADPTQPDHLTLHIRNAYRPESPFHHLPKIADSLREIIARAATQRPDVYWVQCGSWLNSMPPFASLFPPSWIETAQPGRPGSHMGWWGQFQDRRGAFSERNARQFRATGQFPCGHQLCRCRIDKLREHLNAAFPHA